MSDFHGSYKQGLAWKACHDPTVDEVFFGGGARSGKSIFICAHEIIEATTYSGTQGLIGRKEYRTLRDSTLKTWWEVMAMFGYRAGKDYVFKAQDQEVQWSNGSLTMFRHLGYDPGDVNYTRLGSTAFTRAAIDEADECEERLAEMLLLRTGFNTPPHGGKLIVTGNPGEYWTKHRYVYTPKNEPVELNSRQRVILATVADNPDPIVRAEYTRRLQGMRNTYDRERLLNGDWLIQPRSGMEFFPDFSVVKHASKVIPYNPDKALHITFDFNSAPYMTLLVSQIHQVPINKWRVAFLKEYTPAHPMSTTKAACQMLVRDLREGVFKGHKGGIIYYGDASGKAKTSMATDTARHNFDVVENELRGYLDGRSDMVLRRNPPHTKARDFMAHCFAGRLPIEIAVHPDMHTTISDLVHLKQGPDGDILKEYETDPVTKVRYERWGHCSQAMYYEVISAFRSVYDEMEELAG